MIRFTAYLLPKEYIIAFLILSLLLMTGSAYTAEDPCCCEQDTGNIDGDAMGTIDIADLTFLIDHLFINFTSLDCTGKANVDGDTQGTIDIADLTFLIDHLFINFPPLSSCLPIPAPVHQLGGDGEIVCNVDFGPPCASLYVLPFSVDRTFKILGSNCAPAGGHVNWFAYDFNTQFGDTIIASRAGLVIFSTDTFLDTDFQCGNENNVFITHSDGTTVRYTHLKNGGNMVQVGDQVQQGQPIALSGASGCTGGVPHLHFAVFHNRFNFGRQNSICINFSNATGLHDANNGLISGQFYTAEPFE